MPVHTMTNSSELRQAGIRTVVLVGSALLIANAQRVLADEAGVGFWLPGDFGRFTATPPEPGWALPVIYFYSSADQAAEKTFPRAGRVTAGVDARANLIYAAPTYTFAKTVDGAQASIGIAAAYGPVK